MKSQGLPISTIILIVLGMLVLSVITLFFFMGFGDTPEAVTEQQAISKCRSKCSTILASQSTAPEQIAIFANNQDYCSEIPTKGGTILCNDVIICNIEHLDCEINCTDGTASCV